MSNNSIFNHIKNIIILPVNITVVFPYILYRFLNFQTITDDHLWLKVSGAFFILIGLLLLINTIRLFSSKGRGTLAPWNSTRKLVVEGPYKYIRNPMIAGIICILLGEALYLNTMVILIWTMLFFIINSLYFEFIEEPKLERRFGDDYVEYKNKVARWIPKRKLFSRV